MQYYLTKKTVIARDEDRLAKVGDVVLLKELPEKLSKRVAHKVDRIIYGIGNVTDPLTGLKCDKDGYWESQPGEWEAQVKDRMVQEDIAGDHAQRTEGHLGASKEGTAV